MSNEIVRFIEKFIEDNCESLSFSRADIYAWAVLNMEVFYSSKYHLFLNGLRIVMNENANKIFSFNWTKIKSFYKADLKKYDELFTKHRKANKL